MSLTKQRKDVKEYILDQLKEEQNWLTQREDSLYYDFEGCEVPDRLLNEDYFIIGTPKAKQWLGEELFEAIETITEYEKDNFGEVYTDLTHPEKIANMLSYILGNEILSNSEALNFRWNSPVNKYTVDLIIKELELQK